MDYTVVENQNLLKEKLRAKSLLVSFTKTNGERRDMRCTLDGASIPVTEHKTERTARPVSSTSLPVYDVNANAWRSFRWDSIIEVKE
jgi:hypothetical protein